MTPRETESTPEPPVPERNPDFVMPWGTHKGKRIGDLPINALRFLTMRHDSIPGCRKPPWSFAKAELAYRLEHPETEPPKPVRWRKKRPAATEG